MENEESLGQGTAHLKAEILALKNELKAQKESTVMQSMFVSIASHQFRTPLTVIKSNTGLLRMLLRKKDMLNDQTINILNRTESEVTRMVATMDDVLLVGKINSGNIRPKLGFHDLLALCRAAAEDLNTIQEDGRKLEINVEGEPVHVRMDRKLMEHVTSNLLSNAFKYSQNSKPPLLTLKFAHTEVCISIVDYGIGIPEQDHDQIFEPFFRARNASRIAGTGLGTTIVNEFVKMNFGTVSFSSQMGKGTEFTITLPIHSKEADSHTQTNSM